MSDKKPEKSGLCAEPSAGGTAVPAAEVKLWFVKEILPLEAMLMRFLHKNWRNASDVEDLRQEIYAHILKAAETKIPDQAKAFVFATARNLLVDQFRKQNVVPIEAAVDLDLTSFPSEEPGPERSVFAREMLRRLQSALNGLPPRCREAVVLHRIEGLSRRQISQRMGITEQAVANNVARGMFVLADALYGESSTAGGQHDPA